MTVDRVFDLIILAALAADVWLRGAVWYRQRNVNRGLARLERIVARCVEFGDGDFVIEIGSSIARVHMRDLFVDGGEA